MASQDKRHPLRVVDYQLKGVPDAEPLYRLVTNIMTPSEAPAEELAALYAGRWGIETVFDELKTHLRGARIVLRSKTPELVRQEFYGLLLAHLSIRSLMHQAALGSDIAPRDVSFIHAVHVVRRKLPRWAALPPLGEEKNFLAPSLRRFFKNVSSQIYTAGIPEV